MDNLFRIREAAQYLNLSTQTLYKLVKERKIPHVRPTKKILFRESDLSKWLDQHCVEVKD